MTAQGTQNYVYFMDKQLGVGASGNVYLGRHKHKGDLVACKVFRSDVSSREDVARQREFEVMMSLQHENIVKFINVEQESHGKAKILIMEYCAGGSVYKMIEDPVNMFGLPEDEFLIFLRDTTKALTYLRRERIVHRDIKPGNILRCIRDDLGSVYKLTDFGAARKLSDDGEFMSLYGTEEYLHPEVYERALLGSRRPTAPLNASVDLWSLGVTIYHVATGQLPFQAFGGRQNKEDMHRIISQKKSGFISGVQRTKDGEIEWSKELPLSCSLSKGLKQTLERILAGLLETNARRQWTFDVYFEQALSLTRQPPLHVYCVTTASLERVCLDSAYEQFTMSYVCASLAAMTSLPVSDQQLVHDHVSVSEIIPATEKPHPSGATAGFGLRVADDEVDHKQVVMTSSEAPLFLIPKIFSPAHWKIWPLTLPNQPKVPPSMDLSNDVVVSREAAGCVLYLRQCAKRLIASQSHMTSCVRILIKQLADKGRDLYTAVHMLRRGCEQMSRCRSSPSVVSSMESANSSSTDNGRGLDQILQVAASCNFDELLRNFLQTTHTLTCRPEHRCLHKLKKCQKELLRIYEAFSHDKRRELSYNEQQIHKFDRMRIAQWVSRSMSHVRTHCRTNTEGFFQTIVEWFRTVYVLKLEELHQAEIQLSEYFRLNFHLSPSSTLSSSCKSSTDQVPIAPVNPSRADHLMTAFTRSPQPSLDRVSDSTSNVSSVQFISDAHRSSASASAVADRQLPQHLYDTSVEDDSGLGDLTSRLRSLLGENNELIKTATTELNKNGVDLDRLSAR